MKITIVRAEGPMPTPTAILSSFEEADATLVEWSRTAPKKGEGYDKCDVLVEFNDEDSYSFRYDLTRGGGENYAWADLRKNLRNRLEVYSGLRCPDHMSEGQYQELIELAVRRGGSPKELLARVTHILENHP